MGRAAESADSAASNDQAVTPSKPLELTATTKEKIIVDFQTKVETSGRTSVDLTDVKFTLTKRLASTTNARVVFREIRTVKEECTGGAPKTSTWVQETLVDLKSAGLDFVGDLRADGIVIEPTGTIPLGNGQFGKKAFQSTNVSPSLNASAQCLSTRSEFQLAVVANPERCQGW